MRTKREPPKRERTSSYRGVSWHKRAKKFVACIRRDGKGVHLGFFEDEKAAAMAYDTAAKDCKGDAARLNFPNLKGRALAKEQKRCQEAEERLRTRKVRGMPTDEAVRPGRAAKSRAVASITRPVPKRKPTSVYRGVSWDKGAKKFIAKIRWGGQVFHLGFFRDEKAAAMAYDKAAKEGHGDEARLNFANLKGKALAKEQQRCKEEEERLKSLHELPTQKKRKANSSFNSNSKSRKQQRKVANDDNIVLGWSLESDCPWKVTNSEDDLIDYQDFAEAWDYAGHDMPEARTFSRLLQKLERPDGSGNVGKHTNNIRYDNPRHGGTRQNNRSKPFTCVAWKD